MVKMIGAEPWPREESPEVRVARELRLSAEKLISEARRLEEKDKEARRKVLPPVPTALFWRVDVKFTRYGATYTYLLLRHGQSWFTTGTTTETKKFETWAKLWAWLEGPDVYAHSRLQNLIHPFNGDEVEFGEKPVLGIQPRAV